MLYAKAIALIVAMNVMMLTAALRALNGAASNKDEASTTRAFVVAGCVLAAILAWGVQ